MVFFFVLLAVGVILNVDPAEFFINEPDPGDNSTVTLCFEAHVNTTLTRDAIFHLEFANYSRVSPTLGVDFYTSIPKDLIVPADFIGKYEECFDILIAGDNITEYHETIVYFIYPLSPLDDVDFPQHLYKIDIVILDEGKH